MPSVIEITGKLTLDTSDFDAKLDAANQSAQSFAGSTQDVTLGSGASQATADVDALNASMRDATDTANRLSVQMAGEGLIGAGEQISAAAAKLQDFAGASVELASDANESMSAVQTVYGDAADTITTFADDAATSLGMTENQALSASAQLGAMFTSMGLGQQETADLANQLLSASADLGSFHNAMPIEALGALRSGLVGEAEPLKRFGILMSADAVEAKALEMGLADANGEISEGGKVQARAALIMEQLGAAQGDFARTSEGLANAQRIQAAAMADMRAEMGQALLPLQLEMLNVQNKLMGAFAALPPEITNTIAVVGFLGAQLGPLVSTFGRMLVILPQLAPMFSALLGPLGLVVLAIGALGVAYATNFLGFRDAVDSVIGAVMPKLEAFAGWITGVLIPAFQTGDFSLMFGDIGTAVDGLTQRFPILSGVVDAAGAAFGFLGGILSTAATTIQELIAGYQNAVDAGLSPLNAAVLVLSSNFPQLTGAFNLGRDVINNLIETVTGITTALGTAKDALLSGDWAGAFAALGDAGTIAIEGLLEHYKLIGQGILDAFNAVDWQAVSDALMSGLEAASTAIQTWMQGVADDILAAWADIDWAALGDTAKTELGAALDAAWTAIQSALESAWDKFGPIIETRLKAMVTTAESELEAIRTAMEDKLEEARSIVGDKFTEIQTTAETKLEDARAEVDTKLEAVRTLFVDKLEAARTVVVDKLEAARTVFVDKLEAARTVVDDKLEAMRSIIDTKMEAARTAVEGKLEQIKTNMSDAWEGIRAVVDEKVEAIRSLVESKLEDIRSTVETKLNDVKTAFTSLWDSIVSEVTAKIGEVATAISTKMDEIVTTVKTKAEEIKTGFLDSFATFVEDVTSKFAGVKDAIVGAFADAGTWLVEAGKELIGGFIDGMLSVDIPNPLDGIGLPTPGWDNPFDAGRDQGADYAAGAEAGVRDGTPAVGEAAGAVGSTIIREVAEVGGIHSPSTEMYALGQYYLEGLILGAESMTTPLTDAFGKLADAVLGIFEILQSGVSDYMTDLVNDVSDKASAAADAAASLNKTMTSVGGVEPGDREAKERSYEREMRRQDREARRAARGGEEEESGRSIERTREPRVRVRERHRNSGASINIEQIVVKDGRDLERSVDNIRRKERSAAASALG